MELSPFGNLQRAQDLSRDASIATISIKILLSPWESPLESFQKCWLDNQTTHRAACCRCLCVTGALLLDSLMQAHTCLGSICYLLRSVCVGNCNVSVGLERWKSTELGTFMGNFGTGWPPGFIFWGSFSWSCLSGWYQTVTVREVEVVCLSYNPITPIPVMSSQNNIF